MTALSFSGPVLCRKTTLTLTGAAAVAALLSPFGSGPLFAQTPAAVPPAAPAPAADSKMPIKVSVAARISTLGLGIEASALVTPNIAVRLGYNGYTYSGTNTYQGLNYKAKLKLSSVPLLVDLYPFARVGLHFTAGFVFNSNEVTANGQPNANGETRTFTLNGNTYNASDVGSLDGRLSFSKTSPYLGIGIGNPGGGSGLHLLTDIGIVFQGKPKLSLTRSGGTTDPTLSTAINNAVSAQRDKTQSDVNKFQYYPVVSFGVAYHF